jgi:hypothetical protein
VAAALAGVELGVPLAGEEAPAGLLLLLLPLPALLPLPPPHAATSVASSSAPARYRRSETMADEQARCRRAIRVVFMSMEESSGGILLKRGVGALQGKAQPLRAHLRGAVLQ